MCRWMRWDGTGRDRPFLDHKCHRIYFLRQYISRGGYKKSDTNQLILNFKKKPNVSEAQLHYKNKAITTFSIELRSIISKLKVKTALTWIPSSKAKDDPEYDDRLYRVAKIACHGLEKVIPMEFFSLEESVTSLHDGGIRNPETISGKWIYCCPDTINFSAICIIDDVLTTGASMRAAMNKIRLHICDIPIIGIVWALAIDDPNPFEDAADI